ncbi:Outer membrane protein assembly factor BamD [bacterium HR33]|nr:Outer membrane protein assembly factor BamD [bacterium HR33]
MKAGAVLGAFLLAAVAACGGRREPPRIPPETLLEEAKALYRQGKIGPAKERLERVTSGSGARGPVLAEAYYYLGECEFAQGLYLEASRQFRRVADGFPQHPLAPDALLRAGDALAQLWKEPELDPEYGENAMATYRELMGRFPESRAARRAALKMNALAERFAEKDYKNGIFYQRLKAYDSAIIYFRSVVANYAQSSFAPRALIKLVEIYRELDYNEELRETCQHLRNYYPDADGLNEVCPPGTGTS